MGALAPGRVGLCLSSSPAWQPALTACESITPRVNPSHLVCASPEPPGAAAATCEDHEPPSTALIVLVKTHLSRKNPQNTVPGTCQIVLFVLHWRGDLEGAGFEAFFILKATVLLVITETIREHQVQARPLCWADINIHVKYK